jgi:orotidine-5'-phosphate decarboxylase
LHFADRLVAAVREKRTPLCVGLDPRYASLPQSIRQRHPQTLAGQAAAYEEFCHHVIDIVAPHVGVVKPQSAFFEACGPEGLGALRQVLQYARWRGLITILDAKRNDIASTAEAYAEAAFHAFDADALTINPYLGRDSIEPFLKIGRPLGRGLFVLVRTSNPGGGQFQDLALDGRALYSHVAEAVQGWSAEHRGQCGFGDVGAVAGATKPAELGTLRELMPAAIFLVPGYGAQGGGAADTAAAFTPDGLGAVVNSSRGVTFPFAPDAVDWEAAIEKAMHAAIVDLARSTPASRLRA